MRLDLRVLWIDDQPKHVQSVAENVRERLKPDGFELHIVEASSLEQVDARIGEHILKDGIDLVLVDYDLGTGSGGDQALAKIKKRFRYKDLLFYSANDTEMLRKVAFDNKVDGVYFSTRMSLADDVYNFIHSILRKVMDIDHMRGVVMSASSDIDYFIEEALYAIDKNREAASRPAFVNSIARQLREKLTKYDEDLNKAVDKGTLRAIFKLRHICTANDRLNLLIEELSSITKDEKSSAIDKARTYGKDVVPRRNRLAHVVLKELDGKKVLEGNTEQEAKEIFTEDQITALRCDLIEHRENFYKIAVLQDAQVS